MFLRSVTRTGSSRLPVYGQPYLAVVATSKHFATQAATGPDVTNAKPFSEIPGPSKYEFLRGVLPGGKLYKKSIYETINIMAAKYGSFIRFPGMFGKPNFYINLNPDDYSIIFRNEGVWPERRALDTMKYYREVHRKEFFQGVEGLLTTNSEKWAKGRTAINPILMQPRNVIPYLKTMLEVNDEFLARIREIRDPKTLEMPDSFEDDLLRLALESVAAVALNTQLGVIRKNRDTPETKQMINGVRRIFDLLYELDVQPSLWKIVKTPKFREMMKTFDTLLYLSNKYIDDALAKIEEESKNGVAQDDAREKSVLEKLSQIDKKFAVVMSQDLLFAGVDTTTSTLTGILLCVAKNPDKQKKLFDEMKQVMPHKSSHLTTEGMRNLPYLRACIKEGMRLYPILPGTIRKTPKEMVLSGYLVEKDTDIAISANLLLKNEKFVAHANEFLPERWIRGEQESAFAITNPFMYIPFGFGPRSCAGKRLVELELEVTLARLVRNFNIEFNYPTENAFRAKFINIPNIPLKFKFEERAE